MSNIQYIKSLRNKVDALVKAISKKEKTPPDDLWALALASINQQMPHELLDKSPMGADLVNLVGELHNAEKQCQ